MSVQPENHPEIASLDPSAVTIKRLQLCFATLCCLGGVVLAGIDETQTLPYIAAFFAIFGYVFVDRMQIFALPPMLAYISMGCVAIYCIGNFSDIDAPGNMQMVSVANLLVMVQAILMLQKKTLRIFEQLTVFCLLQLIVAAVFNHALSFGLLLIPICLLASTALGLLSSLSANDSMTRQGIRPLFHQPPSLLASQISISGSESFQLASRESRRLPRTILFSFVPAVSLIGAIFFYALPRTTHSARPDHEGKAIVGFSEHLSLQQIGTMQQSSQVALRVRLRKHEQPLIPYRARQGVYLRGQVLERYGLEDQTRRASQTMWFSSISGNNASNSPLPPEFVPNNQADENFYDQVDVDITCESIRHPALFAIAPFFQNVPDKRIIHDIKRSTITRKDKSDRVFPKYRYSFLSHAFRNGIQTQFISQPSPQDNQIAAKRTDHLPSETKGGEATNINDSSDAGTSVPELSAAELAVNMQPQLLAFSPLRTPTAKAIADRIVRRIPEASRDPLQIATRLESYLSTSNEYSYTLDLDRPTVPSMDPIEQFLSVDRAGHCQFFASAMVMMLRSQGIPARIVVGYRTEEYSELGQYYLVRQLHAHAWVEALMNRQYIKNKNALCGQPSTSNYWMRLDPTPSYSLSATTDSGGVSQVFDLAQNIWDDYVVDMDNQRQSSGLASGASNKTMFASYGRFFSWLELRIAAIRAGQLGGGSLAGRPAFSWTAAMLTIAFGIILFVLSRIPIRRWRRSRSTGQMGPDFQQPRFEFYRATLDQLARLGFQRSPSQTPAEIALAVKGNGEQGDHFKLASSLDSLTSIYNRVRYGGREIRSEDESQRGQTQWTLSEPDQSRAKTALMRLQQRIDEITGGDSST